MANTDISYINPGAMAPKFGWMPKNELAGMEWAQQARDYRQVFDQQMRMQALGEEERRLKLDEFKKGLPNADLKRQVEAATMGGQLPYAGEVASSDSQTKIAEGRFRRNTELNPELEQDTVKARLSELKGKMSDTEWKRLGREQDEALRIIEQAQQMDPAEAIGFVQGERERLKKGGFNLPSYMDNPKSWGPLYNSLLKSVKHRQEMEKVDRQGETAKEVARIGAQGRVDAARLGADARVDTKPEPRNQSVEQRVTDVERKMAGASSVEERNRIMTTEAIPAWSNWFYEQPEVAKVRQAAMISKDERMARSVEDARGRFLDSKIRQYGREIIDANTQQKPQQSSSGRKTPPQPGTVLKGYRFKGGDPSKQSNWEKVN